MKSYYFQRKLFLLGKGWQIRHHLRNMLALEKNDVTLVQYLESYQNQPQHGSDKATHIVTSTLVPQRTGNRIKKDRIH